MSSTINSERLFAVQFRMDALMTEEELEEFQGAHTRVRTVHVESDEGELTPIDIEAFEFEEIVDISDDDDDAN